MSKVVALVRLQMQRFDVILYRSNRPNPFVALRTDMSIELITCRTTLAFERSFCSMYPSRREARFVSVLKIEQRVNLNALKEPIKKKTRWVKR